MLKQRSGWHDDWMTWWQDDRKLRRRLTVWYISTWIGQCTIAHCWSWMWKQIFLPLIFVLFRVSMKGFWNIALKHAAAVFHLNISSLYPLMPHLWQEGACGDLQGLPPVPDDQLDRRHGLAPAGQPRQPGTAGHDTNLREFCSFTITKKVPTSWKRLLMFN